MGSLLESEEGAVVGRILLVELSEEEYESVESAARAAGSTPSAWAARVIREQTPHPPDASCAPLSEAAFRGEYEGLVLDAARERAARRGNTLEEELTAWRSSIAPKSHAALSPEERAAARQRLLRHCGAVDSGEPDASENDRIDADLARAYGHHSVEPD